MKKVILALLFFILNPAINLIVNAEQLLDSKDISDLKSIKTNKAKLIKRRSFEFGFGGAQFQIRGSYIPDILNDNLDIFLKTGIGFIATKASYGFDVGANFELGGKYFFYNQAFLKLLTGYSIPFSNSNITGSNKAFYAGIGIGNDFVVEKNWGINVGLDLSSTFESGQNGLGGLIFLRPEVNIKYSF